MAYIRNFIDRVSPDTSVSKVELLNFLDHKMQFVFIRRNIDPYNIVELFPQYCCNFAF